MNSVTFVDSAKTVYYFHQYTLYRDIIYHLTFAVREK